MVSPSYEALPLIPIRDRGILPPCADYGCSSTVKGDAMLRRIRQIMHAEDIAILPPSASVYAAAAVMKRQRQCGVLVMTKERLEGILQSRTWFAG